MLTLEQKKLKKKILDNLVIHDRDIIETERKDTITNETIPIFGVYSGHLDINFKNKFVTIEYYLTDTKGNAFDKKDKTYFGPKELFAGGQIYKVGYCAISRHVIATEQKQKEMYENAKAKGKKNKI